MSKPRKTSFSLKIKQKNITKKKAATTVIAIIAIFLAAFSFGRYRVAQENADIRGLVLTYYQAIDNREFSLVSDLFTPGGDASKKNYVDNLTLKMQAVDMKHIRVTKIYPAIVNGKYGLVGVVSETSNLYNGEESSFREFNLILAKKVQGRWYLAKPEDAKELGEDRIEKLFDDYQSTVKGDGEEIKKIVSSQKEMYVRMQEKKAAEAKEASETPKQEE